MRILYVTSHVPWPATYGGPIRTTKTIEYLSKKHEVMVAILNTSYEPIKLHSESTTQSFKVIIIPETPLDLLNMIRRFTVAAQFRSSLRPHLRCRSSKAFHEMIKEIKPDLIWYRHASTLWRTGPPPNIPSVFDMDDLESSKYERRTESARGITRLLMQTDIGRFFLEQAKVASWCDVSLLANPEDIKKLENANNIMAYPNGFDFPEQCNSISRHSDRILFYGNLKYWPNSDGIQWFCDNVWLKIIEQYPNTKLDIVGSYNTELNRLKRITNVKLHGFVPDLSPFISNSAFTIVPLRVGGGTRIKIIEAWAKGLPVVSTTVGCEGLDAKDNETLLIADTPDDLAKKCLQLLKNPEQGEDLSRRAFKHGKDSFDWTIIFPIIDEVVNQAQHHNTLRNE